MNSSLSTRRIAVLLAAAGFGLVTASAGAQVLANAHDDFSGLQGFNNWYYGFFNGDSDTPWIMHDFEQLPIFDGDAWRRQDGPGGYWTDVTSDGGHPNGLITSGGRVSENNWSVRRWIADGDYVINAFGRAWDANPIFNANGNGVIVYVMVDGSTIWQAVIEAGNQHGLEYDLQFCTVPGTIVDFVIDPRDSNDLADDTGFHSTIRTIIDHGPVDTLTCPGGAAQFEVITIPGMYNYQWRHNGVPIEHDGDASILRIINANPDKAGLYDCIVMSGCGSMISNTAMLTVCAADYDCDGVIDSQDFFTFLPDFFSNDPRADFNHDSFINSQDYFDFLTAFFTRCS